MRRFHNTSPGHSKFWEHEAPWDMGNGTIAIVVRWGRIGSYGQSQTKQFGSTYSAQSFLLEKIQEKLDKGYYEVDSGGGAKPAPAPVKKLHIMLGKPEVVPFTPPLPPKPPPQVVPKMSPDNGDDLAFLEVLGL